jgi:hypothetical protein
MRVLNSKLHALKEIKSRLNPGVVCYQSTKKYLSRNRMGRRGLNLSDTGFVEEAGSCGYDS